MEQAREYLETSQARNAASPRGRYREAARKFYEERVKEHTKPTLKDLRPVVLVAAIVFGPGCL